MPAALPLITVDLIENAFKHADLQTTDTFISIVYEVKGRHFRSRFPTKSTKSPRSKRPTAVSGKKILKSEMDILYGNRAYSWTVYGQ